MTEYKPLAKIEEMEEQNYNMVDNVLNNGAGEKALASGQEKINARKLKLRNSDKCCWDRKLLFIFFIFCQKLKIC